MIDAVSSNGLADEQPHPGPTGVFDPPPGWSPPVPPSVDVEVLGVTHADWLPMGVQVSPALHVTPAAPQSVRHTRPRALGSATQIFPETQKESAAHGPPSSTLPRSTGQEHSPCDPVKLMGAMHCEPLPQVESLVQPFRQMLEVAVRGTQSSPVLQTMVELLHGAHSPTEAGWHALAVQTRPAPQDELLVQEFRQTALWGSEPTHTRPALQWSVVQDAPSPTGGLSMHAPEPSLKM